MDTNTLPQTLLNAMKEDGLNLDQAKGSRPEESISTMFVDNQGNPFVVTYEAFIVTGGVKHWKKIIDTRDLK